MVGERGGPFRERDRSGSFADSPSNDDAYFPSGPPRPGSDWIISHGANFGRLVEFARRLFVLNITTPNEARRNTTEAFDRYLVGVLPFDVLLPKVSDSHLNCWAGEAAASEIARP